MEDRNFPSNSITIELMQTILSNMLISSTNLKEGYQSLSQYEQYTNFYINLLHISLDTQNINRTPKVKKLASSSLLIFLRKNWSDDLYISFKERQEIIQTLLNSIKLFYTEYYNKNYISNLLGIIASKGYPNDSFNQLLEVLLMNLSIATDNEIIDMILRIIQCILNESDDRMCQEAKIIIPIILQVFSKSTHNQKNREKCLVIIYDLFIKLCHADGTDDELLTNTLKFNENMSNCFKLFSSILSTRPNMLFDLKRIVIKIIGLLISDMPSYFNKYTIESIKFCYQSLIDQLPYYSTQYILNQPLLYSKEELDIIQSEMHYYKRGYESDEEDETYGLEGLILALLNVFNDAFNNSITIDFLKQKYYDLLIILKCYLLLPYSSINLYQTDLNSFFEEEYLYDDFDDKEDTPLTIRSQCILLIKSISSLLDSELLLLFIKTNINELINEGNTDTYKSLVKTSYYSDIIQAMFSNLSTNKNTLCQMQEVSLYIIGSLSELIASLISNNQISINDIQTLIDCLFNIISNPSNNPSIVIGRAIWCIKKLTVHLFKEDLSFYIRIIKQLVVVQINLRTDLGIQLINAQTLSALCIEIKGKEKSLVFNDETVSQLSSCLISLLKSSTQETINILLQALISLSIVNKPVLNYLQFNYYHQLLEIYINQYHNPNITISFKQLFKIWSYNSNVINNLLSTFLQLFLKVIKDLYPNIFKEISNLLSMNDLMPIKIGSSDSLLLAIITMVNTIIISNHSLINYQSNEAIILFSLSLICEIILTSKDTNLIQNCCLFLSSLLMLNKGRLSINQSSSQGIAIRNVITKLLLVKQTNSHLIINAGLLITLFYIDNENQIPPNVIEGLIQLIYSTETSYILQFIVIVIARLIIKYPKETITYLSSLKSNGEVSSALGNVLIKWLNHQEMFEGRYVIGITINALSIVFEMECINTIGEVSINAYEGFECPNKVSAPLKILMLFANYLKKDTNEIKEELDEEDIELYLSPINDPIWDYNIKVHNIIY